MSQTILTTLWPKLIETLFASAPTDCCFQFLNKSTNVIAEIPAHRKLLAILSPVFATMFDDNWGENSSVNLIEDASLEAFNTFLGYFYKGKLELNTSNFDEIFYLANKYNMVDLFGMCSSFATYNLNAENVLQYYEMGFLLDSKRLMRRFYY